MKNYRKLVCFMIAAFCFTLTACADLTGYVNPQNVPINETEYKLKSSMEIQNFEAAREALEDGIDDINKFSDKRLWQRTNHNALESNPTRIAMFSGSYDVAELLLESGADANYQDSNGESLLQAATEANIDFINILIKHGADINCVCENGKTALEYAVSNQSWDAAEIILSYEPQIRKNAFDEILRLYESGEDELRKGFKIFKELLEREPEADIDEDLKAAILGEQPKSCDDNAQLIGDASAAFGDTRALAKILADNENLDISSLYRCAALYGNTENLKYLSGVYGDLDVTLSDKSADTAPIQLAALYGSPETVKYLFYIQPQSNTAHMCENILVSATANNDLETARFILSQNIDASYIKAAESAIKNHSDDILRELLLNGLDPNSDANAQSLMELACFNNDITAVRYLLEFGANINGNRNGEPLSVAARRGNIEIVEFLIRQGADVNGNNIFQRRFRRKISFNVRHRRRTFGVR